MQWVHLKVGVHKSKRAISAIGYSLCALISYGQSATFDGSSYFQDDNYNNGIIAVSVSEGNNTLFAREDRKAVSPASTLKLITTGASWAKLGGDFKAETKLAIDTPVASDGTLNGSLYIIGGGDPCLGSDRVAGSLDEPALLDRWTKAIQKAGIKKINGNIIGDSSAWTDLAVPGSWSWTDIGNYYGAGPYALNYNDNLYDLHLQPGKNVGDPASIVKTVPPTSLHWQNQLFTAGPGTGDQAYIYSAPMSNHAVVRGTIPQGGEFEIRGSLSSPPLTAAQQLFFHLPKNNIPVSGTISITSAPIDAGTILDTLPSPPLSAISKVINEKSFNLYAEALLLHTGDANAKSQRDSALSYESKFLTDLGVDTQGFSIRDGSGLSPGNKITARGMTEYLHAMRSQPFFNEWHKTINVYGNEDASSRKALNAISGAVQAKTGTIGGVRGFCGYIKTKSGKQLEFAVLAQNHRGGNSSHDAETDRLLNALYEAY